MDESATTTEETIDEVRETTLKEEEKSQENSLHLQPLPQQIANIRVLKKWRAKEAQRCFFC